MSLNYLANMNTVVINVCMCVAAGFVLSTAIDLFAWSFSGTYRNTAESLIDKLLNAVVEMPVKLLYAAVNVVIGLIESVLKMVFSIIGLSSVADRIQLHYMEA